MFKDGFILNYYPGAKGDFLIRFLSNLDLTFNNAGKSPFTAQFGQIKEIFQPYNIRKNIEVNSQPITSAILNLPKVWPYNCHFLHFLSEENVNQILASFNNAYDLIVEEQHYNEVLLNSMFKNYNIKLTDEAKAILKEEFSNFDGVYNVDRFILLFEGITSGFTDDMRVDFIASCMKEKLGINIKLLNKFSSAQKNSNTKKIYYSKTFYPPYTDFADIYYKFNKKTIDYEKLERVIEKTHLPQEFVYFNHKIKIDLESDNIITVTN